MEIIVTMKRSNHSRIYLKNCIATSWSHIRRHHECLRIEWDVGFDLSSVDLCHVEEMMQSMRCQVMNYLNLDRWFIDRDCVLHVRGKLIYIYILTDIPNMMILTWTLRIMEEVLNIFVSSRNRIILNVNLSNPIFLNSVSMIIMNG